MAGNSGYVDFIATNYSSQQTLRVYWQETVNDSPGATSTVEITKVQLASQSYIGDTYYADFIIQINGTTVIDCREGVGGYGGQVYLSQFNTFTDVTRGGNQLTGSVSGIAHDSQGKKSINITLAKNPSTGYSYGGFWRMGAHFAFTTTSVSKAISLYQIPVGLLSISAATGSTITVTRSGSALSAGAKLWYGQQLVITFAASYGWRLDSHTVNGQSFDSGDTHSVTGNVAVATTASRSASTIATPNGTFGTSQTLTITRYISGATHTIKAVCAGQTQNITGTPSWSGDTGTLAWTPAPSIMNSIPNAMSASCVIEITTFSGSLEIGTTSITITLSLPTSGTYNVTPNPTITDSDANGYASAMGGYVAGKSVLSVSIADGLKYSATVATRSTSANGVTSQAASFSAGLLSGNTSISTSVKDSRGRTGTASKNITVQAYDSPAISTFAARRTDDQGTHSPVGAYMTISWAVAITSLGGHNTMTLGLKYKKRSSSTWTTVDMSQAGASGTTAVIPADIASSYDIQFTLADYFETVTKTMKLSTAAVVESRRPQGKGVAFSKVAEIDNAFDVGSWNAIGRVMGLGQARASIPANADLDDYAEPGVYGISSDTIASALSNCPSSLAGTLRVWESLGAAKNPGETWQHWLQEFTNREGNSWRRSGLSGSGTTVTWSAWLKMTTDVQSTDTFSVSYGGVSTTARVTKVGNTVEFYATIGTGTAFSGLTGIDGIGTIPVEYRPIRDSWTSVSARDNGTWASANYTTALLYVKPDGTAQIRGNTSVMQTMKYMLFSATWLTA